MKTLLALSMMIFASSSFAITDQDLVQACSAVGISKVIAQADVMGLEIDQEAIYECGIHNQGPTGYVWFCAEASNGEIISKATQKPFYTKCF